MSKAEKTFGHQLRVRVCGILIEDNQILLVKHSQMGKHGILWSPPGGGMNYNENAEEALKREFQEEVNLEINVEQFLFVNEFQSPPYHAIELFFLAKRISGSLKKGIDTELSPKDQMIEEVEFVTFEKLNRLPNEEKHNVLKAPITAEALLKMNGYFKLC